MAKGFKKAANNLNSNDFDDITKTSIDEINLNNVPAAERDASLKNVTDTIGYDRKYNIKDIKSNEKYNKENDKYFKEVSTKRKYKKRIIIGITVSLTCCVIASIFAILFLGDSYPDDNMDNGFREEDFKANSISEHEVIGDWISDWEQVDDGMDIERYTFAFREGGKLTFQAERNSTQTKHREYGKWAFTEDGKIKLIDTNETLTVNDKTFTWDGIEFHKASTYYDNFEDIDKDPLERGNKTYIVDNR